MAVSEVIVPERGALRAIRGCALAVTSAVLALAAHLVAGGVLPDPALSLLLALVLGTSGIAVAQRRRRGWAILLVVAVTQVALHAVLRSPDGLSSPNGHGAVSAPAVAGSVPMVLAHAMAVLLTAWLLTGAESAIFVVAAALSLVLPKRLAPLPVVAPVVWSLPEPVRPANPVLMVLLRRVWRRRGPPRALGGAAPSSPVVVTRAALIAGRAAPCVDLRRSCHIIVLSYVPR